MATERKQNWNGMNWISQHKRLAIYLRDGLACCYCGVGVEDGAQLTLDHLKPHSKGGSNEATNLCTCCHKCNSSRGNRSWQRFCKAVAGYINHGVTAEQLIKDINNNVRRTLPLTEAKTLVARRGSCSKVLAKMA